MNGLIYGGTYYSSWILYVLPALVIAMLAQGKVKTTFARYSRLPNTKNYTGYEVARMILDRQGLNSVKIEHIRGNLTDHYDPRTNTVRLSDGVYNKTSIAAMSVAAHEVGHAIQHAEGYFPLKLRTAIAPIAAIGSNMVWGLIFLGMVVSTFFIELGIALFIGVVAFQIVTLPVEFNASSRALIELENGIASDENIRGSKSVLNAAALTYVAATLVAIGNLLRILAVTNNSRNKR